MSMTPERATELDDAAFEMFAMCYPHEAYAEWPERFWVWFHQEHPKIDRATMEATLARTDVSEGPTP